jgi:hypothetical protein
MNKNDYIDWTRPELGRRVQATRNLPVDDLTPLECKALMVHSHDAGPERRKAYWDKWFAWFASPEGSNESGPVSRPKKEKMTKYTVNRYQGGI